MRVLGIDPGLRIAGYGCIELESNSATPSIVEAGAIRMNTKESVSFRLQELYENVREVITELSPDLLAVESVFTHRRQVATAIIMGHTRGVILLAGQQASLPLVELAPAEIKKSITGNGRASKEQIQHAVASVLRLAEIPHPPDVADALAIAITAAMRN
jgi:crossover junction endodeoxyribonuclease RuvC